jgi:hypothetical protein
MEYYNLISDMLVKGIISDETSVTLLQDFRVGVIRLKNNLKGSCAKTVYYVGNTYMLDTRYIGKQMGIATGRLRGWGNMNTYR